MATNCGRIASGVARDCDNPLVGGVSDELILINYSDITGYTLNSSNPQIIEGVSLISSPQASGYMFQGFKNSVEPTATLKPSAYINGWGHQVVFRIFDNSPETKAIIDGMANGLFVAIIKNNNRGTSGRSKYELFGKFAGLELTVGESNKNDADTQGGWVLTLSTSDTDKEPKTPATIYLTSETVTDALVESLY